MNFLQVSELISIVYAKIAQNCKKQVRQTQFVAKKDHYRTLKVKNMLYNCLTFTLEFL